MSRNKIILFASIVFIISAGFAIYTYTFRASEKSVEDHKSDIQVEASVLLRAFMEDEQKANTLYLDKIIQVSGIISEIQKDDLFLTITLKNSDELSGVICVFDISTVSPESFSAGKVIRLKGQCTGYLMDVVLTKCALVE